MVHSIIVSAVTRDHAEGLQYHVLPTNDPVRALNICVKPLGYNHFLMSTMTRAAEARAPTQTEGAGCRICRDSHVRRLVNDLLDLRGAPAIVVGGNKGRRITYTDILGMLEPLNEGRDKGTGSPMTASGFTPSGTTTLPG